MRTIKTYFKRAPFYNALSLTTPAYFKTFFLKVALLSRPVRWRSNRVYLSASLHLCHPNLLCLFSFIASVLPTKHLCSHDQL
jgi:hypothetical protein